MDVCEHSRYLPEGSEELVDLPAQSSILHCVRDLGIGRTKTPIWARVGLLSVPICHYYWCLFTIPILAMATMASKVQGQIHQHSNHSERRRVYSSGHWHQLLFVVCGRIHLPILDSAEKLFMVVQVQLHHKCCAGLWCVCISILSREFDLTCSLSIGTVFCFIFIFFTLQFPKGGVSLKWWGNQVWMKSEYFLKSAVPRTLTSPPAADYNRTSFLEGPVPQS